MFPIHFKLTVGTVAELQRLTAFLAGDTAQAVLDCPKLPAEAPGKPATPAPSPRTAKAAVVDAPAQPTAQPEPQPSTETAATASSAAPQVTYPDLQKAVLTLHKRNPLAAVPIAKSLGADTFKLLKETQWADALRMVNEAIAAEDDRG